jgi:beta-fructofuranosidase
MLRLAPSWLWDSWLADDGERYHLFFLKASRALQDPDRRHARAGIGHAVSRDLVRWTEEADALVADDGPAFDDLATWTGSVVRDPAGLWRLFYTGIDRTSGGLVQRIGQATSTDLVTWHRTGLLLESDARWYEKAPSDAGWPDEAWRDPWVMPGPGGEGWRMLVTARAAHGERNHRGVVGQATSDDLETWRVGPPLSTPDAGFGQLEVIQHAVVDGQALLMFSCLPTEMATERPDRRRGGVWVVPVEEPLERVDVDHAVRVTSEALYSGRLVQDRSGAWVMLAFRNVDEEGRFVGEITDPIPVTWDGSGLRLTGVPAGWLPD